MEYISNITIEIAITNCLVLDRNSTFLLYGKIDLKLSVADERIFNMYNRYPEVHNNLNVTKRKTLAGMPSLKTASLDSEESIRNGTCQMKDSEKGIK